MFRLIRPQSCVKLTLFTVIRALIALVISSDLMECFFSLWINFKVQELDKSYFSFPKTCLSYFNAKSLKSIMENVENVKTKMFTQDLQVPE